ncbi:hypothetical protein ACFO8O_14585 [Hephaestia sp. GCM10023244]|uniref:hypothetical protein n=1 Tax=unclassified Hephaestia TaxID=2631281 RepID=UPI0020776F0C|nr:hypothetical protein [Hephaestia sp. MAHUQ-44]MCM8732188.1 hypothetical protein [Hephaestia sp. MAHUQ-44]
MPMPVPIIRLSLATALATSAPAAAQQPIDPAQQRIDPSPNADLQTDQDRTIAVRQIPQESTTPARRNAVEQVGQAKSPPAEVAQLPGDAEALSTAAAPESELEQATPRSPRADLYAEVAAVWEVIRRRGQQPTPELIAREIGPDMLARFLNTFPGSEGIFGIDSDRLPLKPPPDLPAPAPETGD